MPVVCVGDDSSVSLSSLNMVGYLTPRPLPMSPTLREWVGANTSTKSLALLLFVLLSTPPNLGTL